jgi:hypothetical protein
VILNAALLELLFGLTVGLREVVYQCLVPGRDEFVVGLAGDEVVLVGEVPVRLGVVMLVYPPLVVGTAVLRV